MNRTGADLMREARERLNDLTGDEDVAKQVTNVTNLVTGTLQGQVRRMVLWGLVAIFAKVAIYASGAIAVLYAAAKFF